MKDLATIARENAIGVEGKLAGHAKRADGGLNIRIMIGPPWKDIPQQLRDAPIGTRYQIALVEINDDETPTVRPAASLESKGAAPRSYSLAQRAGMLAKDELFWRFLEQTNGLKGVNETDAAEWIRLACKVTSRSRIAPGTYAAHAYETTVVSPFMDWVNAAKVIP